MAKRATIYCLLLHLSLVLFLTSNSSSQSTARPNAGQLHALRAIMRDWGSPAALSPWSTGNWTGVTCNRDGLVTALNFNNFHIANPIPTSLCSLKNLSFIDLCFNNLTGRFPRVLYGCSALQHLDLSNNDFTSDLPGDMSKISSEMRHLNLSSNGFTGGIGPVVAAVSLLQLDLSMNRLTGSIPEAIGKMKNLGLLFLCCNNITGPIPASVGLLPNLTDVRLFNNKLSGPLPPELGKHSDLGHLDVSNNLLSGKLPESLCFNKQFLQLVVHNNRLSGVFPAGLGECDTLINIVAHNNRFVGDFPKKIWSMAKLTNVQIENNNFTGTLPTTISSNITRIEMGRNMFSGRVPSSGAVLAVFSGENNQFTGKLPAQMSGVTYLNLAGNRISGPIPPSIQSFARLAYLNLSSNKISGAIPASIGSLPGLNILDLSNNKLSGDIPHEVGNLHLNFLNLSSNNLAGQVPLSMQTPAYDRSFLGNSGLCVAVAAKLNMSLPTCGRSMGSTGLIVLFAALSGVVLVAALVVARAIIHHQKEQRDLSVRREWKITAFTHLGFSESDIIDNLREDNVVGSGGCGKVYRVKLRGRGRAGQVVAVKRLLTTSKPDANLDKQFDSEVKILGGIRHDNIVSLHCYISNEATKLLVFEYMENGSLDGWLHLHHPDGALVRAPLDWPTRLAIAIDAARGLSHMHHECVPPIMHRDVKSSNILLDGGFHAKIGDFGLARLLQSCRTEEVSAICGTWGYIAPEQRWRKVNEKVDVYSFGVVLLELTTGRVARDIPASFILAEWASEQYRVGEPLYHAVDGNISDGPFLDDIVAVFKLGVICTGEEPKSRPSMQMVLEHLIQIQQDRAPQTPE